MPGGSGEEKQRELTRRELLGVLGVGTVGAAFKRERTDAIPRRSAALPGGVAGPVVPAATQVGPTAVPFALGDVELLESEFTRARERDAAYMLDLDPDRLLHNFRVNAGLQPKAPVYGGWESQEPWVDIRCHGHTLGHWLSAGALIYASTGDVRFRERVDHIVDELAACQRAGGTGLVCAFPDGAEQLEASVRGERFVGVPWYTMHKVMAGLRDAHVQAGSATALEVLVGITDWALEATAPLTDEGFERMLRREHGGMNEVLADVHALTGEGAYLTLAERFSHKALLEPLSQGRDTLDGLHANTQIPKVIGFQRLFELTGRQEYRNAARFFWDTVVDRRSFATGGHGDVEHFFPPEEFPDRLDSAKTMETCCSHNMLRLTRMLFADEPSARFADFYERALYNAILASQDPDSGMCTYFQATRPGYLKLYHTPIDSFWCCTGSGMENHAKYGDSIYFRSGEALWVNLFVPSSVTWREKGLVVTQATAFPDEPGTRLTVTAERPVRAALHVRHPAWCDGASATLNGRTWEGGAGEPGSWLTLDREWRSGDTVEVRLPMSIRTEGLPGAPDRVAVLYGPIVLAGRLGREGLYPGADILRNERTSGDILNVPVEVPSLATSALDLADYVRSTAEPLSFETVGIGRPRDVTLVPYHRIAHERYNLYWELAGV